MENIKTIQHFDNAYDLLFEHDFEVNSVPAFAEFLKTVDDFSDLAYIVINFDTVYTVDETTGDVYRIDSITDFYKESIAEFHSDSLGD